MKKKKKRKKRKRKKEEKKKKKKEKEKREEEEKKKKEKKERNKSGKLYLQDSKTTKKNQKKIKRKLGNKQNPGSLGECRGDVTGKPGQDWDHAEVPHPLQNLVLQDELLGDPRLWQWASPSLDVAHPRPAAQRQWIESLSWPFSYHPPLNPFPTTPPPNPFPATLFLTRCLPSPS